MGCVQFDATPFDWEGVTPPNLPPQDLIVYECTTRAFTADDSSALAPGRRCTRPSRRRQGGSSGGHGTFPASRSHFDEMEFQRSPNPRDHMHNRRGYSTMSFFAPMTPYASEGARGPRRGV